MAYIGKINKSTSTLATQTMDSMTGDGTTTTLSLTSTPLDVNDVSIYTDGVMQEPGVDYTLDGNTVTFTTAVPLNCYVCACQTQNGDIGTPAADSVTTDKLTDGMFTDSHISSLSASKLTGALPVLDGSAITGVGTGFMENASDPAVDTNPADGLGAVWVNTTTGNIYICTDATTDANVWVNVGGGSGNVVPFVFQGENYGYVSGGYPYPSGAVNVIDKFSFATATANATDVGDLSVARHANAGQSSPTHGYTSASNNHNVIDKFPFATDSNATDVGDCSVARSSSAAGQSSGTYGYTSGGNTTKTIDKFSFATDGNATDVGDLTVARSLPGGQSSTTHGYSSGGIIGGPPYDSNYIDKFTFASNNDATDVGDLTGNRRYCTGQSSTAYGYTSGGFLYPNSINVIDRFSFASDGNAVDVGDLTVSRQIAAGQQY